MSFWVYIIQSETSGRFYCGQTSDVERRIRQHNDPAYHLSKTTKRFEGPWRLVWFEECISRGEAIKLEERVKKRGVKRFFQDVQPAESRRGGINH